MKVLQVSASDGGGGAHKIAGALHKAVRERGHESAFAVGRRTTQEPGVQVIPLGVSNRRRIVYGVARRAVQPFARRVRALKPLRRALRTANPLGYLRAQRDGREYFDFPGSRRLLDLPPFAPDIVNCHNLHSNFFDLRFLAPLSARVPVALTLHDEWTFTGHCAYTMGIDRWRTGCGGCGDLAVYPAILHDGSHENWLAKRAIYGASRLYVSAPSRWLLDRARESILADGAVDWRHIPNGVDQRIFRPIEQGAARDLLGLPREGLILLFAANLLRTNPFKDYDTVATAVEMVAAALSERKVLLVALGAESEATVVEHAEMRFVPYETDPTRVAAYYQAADAYLHAAKADTFPTTVLEALSAGRPVIATAVGGIPEQVRSVGGVPGSWSGAAEPAMSATGVLVEAQDATGMATAAIRILRDDALRAQLGRNAAADAAARFALDRQLDDTLAWYGDAIDDWRAWRAGRG